MPGRRGLKDKLGVNTLGFGYGPIEIYELLDRNNFLFFQKNGLQFSKVLRGIRNRLIYKKHSRDFERALKNLNDLDGQPPFPNNLSELSPIKKEDAVSSGFDRFWRDFMNLIERMKKQ